MTISSKTLFHFTKKKEWLIDILSNGIKPRYCTEFCWGKKHLAIPMICFCDIPMSQILHHIGKYGGEGYGIGISKGWAVKKGITPLLYFSYENKSVYKRIYNYAAKMECAKTKNIPMEEQLIYYAKRVSQSGYERELLNPQKVTKRTKYYNEREWRYVPDISDKIHMRIFPSKNFNPQLCKECCEQLNRQDIIPALMIPEEAVEYIILPNKEERSWFITKLTEIFEDKNDKLKSYISKIITVEQIKQDF